MLARTETGCLLGIEAHPIVVEAQVGKGLPVLDLVGLPDRSSRECVVRVKSALAASGFELPPSHLVVNVAPSDLRKTSSGFDLPVALAILGAIGVLPGDRIEGLFSLAELSLSGELRPVPGGLVQLRSASLRGLRRAVVATDQHDAALASGIEVAAGQTLRQVVEALRLRGELPRLEPRAIASAPPRTEDLADVLGQEAAKRALVLAAAGEHALILSGPPGSGKTMLARRLVGLLPPPSASEAMTIATIASAAGLREPAGHGRPFRAPHHTASASAISGGGDPIRPGEVTLAHGGVLFLDELPEFRRDVIEGLRTTMEQGAITIVRAHGRATMPARPLVVAAMNPCACGFSGDPKKLCTCTPDRLLRYRSRLSGPLLDRFDLHVVVPRPSSRLFSTERPTECTEAARRRVLEARALLAESGSADPRSIALSLSSDAKRLLERSVERLGLSARVHAKVLRVARTVAALRNSTVPAAEDVAEALQYRGLDARSSAPGEASVNTERNER